MGKWKGEKLLVSHPVGAGKCYPVLVEDVEAVVAATGEDFIPEPFQDISAMVTAASDGGLEADGDSLGSTTDGASRKTSLFPVNRSLTAYALGHVSLLPSWEKRPGHSCSRDRGRQRRYRKTGISSSSYIAYRVRHGLSSLPPLAKVGATLPP